MRVVTHNSPRVVTPISPCDVSVINKKAHGRKCWLCLWISSLFSHSRRGGNPGLKFYRRASNTLLVDLFMCTFKKLAN